MIKVRNSNFAQFHKNFIANLKERGRSESTLIAYSKDTEQLLNFFSDKGILKLEDTSIEILELYKKYLQDSNYTPKSVSRKINSTRTFYKYLVEANLLTDNPSDKLAHPKFETKPPRVLSEMEYRALRDVSRTDTRLYSIIEILLQTGIRIGELAALTIDDIRTHQSGAKSINILLSCNCIYLLIYFIYLIIFFFFSIFIFIFIISLMNILNISIWVSFLSFTL